MLARLVCLAALLFATANVSADHSVPKNKVPATVKQAARGLIRDLTGQGYEVTQGYFKLYTEDDRPTKNGETRC